MQEVLKDYLVKLEKIISAKTLDELDTNDIFELNSFHASEVYMLTENDNYLLGMRANHFVIESGFSEIQKGKCYLVSANHKGIRMHTLLLDSSIDPFR